MTLRRCDCGAPHLMCLCPPTNTVTQAVGTWGFMVGNRDSVRRGTQPTQRYKPPLPLIAGVFVK